MNEDYRSRYLDLLLSLAKQNADPDLLDRIERALGGDKPADARVKGSTKEDRATRYRCPQCGGKKSFYATHCIKCNAGTVGNRGGKGGDVRSEEARQKREISVVPVEPARPTAQDREMERKRENEEIAQHIDDPLRVEIGEPVIVDPRLLPPWQRRQFADALKNRDGKKAMNIAQSAG